MKLYRKDFNIWHNAITLIPTIQIVVNQPIYPTKSIELSFHFLTFHARLLWAKPSYWPFEPFEERGKQ
jgi:hypothetical protein